MTRPTAHAHESLQSTGLTAHAHDSLHTHILIAQHVTGGSLTCTPRLHCAYTHRTSTPRLHHACTPRLHPQCAPALTLLHSLCIVLQCVAVCCSVLQCVVVCCSVLQCIVPFPAGNGLLFGKFPNQEQREHFLGDRDLNGRRPAPFGYHRICTDA